MKKSKFFFQFLFTIFFILVSVNINAQNPYIQTGNIDGLGQYGYLEKDATTFMRLNSNTFSNINQLYGRTFLNGNVINTYGNAVAVCGGTTNVVQNTYDYNFGVNAIAGQIAYTSVMAEYCLGAGTGGGFNERQHYIFDISDRSSDLSASIKPLTGSNSVVMSVKIDFGSVSDRVLQKFWIQNTGTIAESTEIANDGFKLYYETATGTETFDGTESSATIYGDYNANSTSNNIYGHDHLSIPIPAGGLRIYVVLNQFNNTNIGGKTVQVSLLNDSLTFTPKMDSNFDLARVNQIPASPTIIGVPKDYTWNGSSDNTWGNATNWTPNGIPTAIDNVTINVPGTNVLNLPLSKTINDFNLTGTGTFILSATGALTINGNVFYGGTATATLDCASIIKITNSATQPIPPLNYGNLDVLGGNRILSNSGTIGICGAFAVDQSLYTYTVTGSTVNYFSSATGWVMPSFTYNHLIYSGTGNFSIGKSTPASDKTVNVQGNFLQTNGTVFLGDTSTNTATINVDGNATFTGGTFKMNTTTGGNGSFNLKGNLSVAASASLSADNSTANFNFTGTAQTIEVASATIAKVNFNVKSGASVKLINQDLALGTSSTFTVESGSTFDFGFNGTTALNMVKAGSQILQQFELKDGGNLKITSPLGITTSATPTDGNVQLPTRIFASGLNTNYYYIGKANQVTGNALPTSTSILPAPSRNVIVAMDNDAITLKASGVQRFNSSGTLEIQKGTVDDEPSNNFANSGIATELGNLKMSGGRYLLNTTTVQPDLLGNYSLTGGIVEFKNSTVTGQSIRGGKSYLNIEVTGNNVGRSIGDITLLDNGTFTVKNGGDFTINSQSITGTSGMQTVTIENGGLFRTGDVDGFSGNASTSIQSSVENIILQDGSTVEYSRPNTQKITSFNPLLALDSNLNTGGYYNLKLTGDNLTNATFKTIETTTTPVYVRNNLQIESPSFLKIEANKAIIIKENIANNGSMLIESDGNLLQKNDAATFTGNSITAKRTLSLSSGRQQYNYLISPLDGVSLISIYKDVSGNPVNVPFVLYHNEATNKFYSSTGVYIKGRGLAVKEPLTGIAPVGFNGTAMNSTFLGKPANGAFNFTIVKGDLSDPQRGFNLIGNPYPSNIDLNAFYPLNSGHIDATFYFWDNKANTQTTQLGSSYGGQAYATFNVLSQTGTMATGDVSAGTKAPTRYVKTGQGFMVKSLAANTDLVFNNSIRTAENGTTTFFGKNAERNETPVNRYWLNMISPNDIASNIAMVYFPEGNNAFAQDDSRSMGGSDAIYSLVENEKVSINGRSNFVDTDIIPLGSQHFSTGNYKIELAEKEGVFNNGQSIYLKDNQMGIITNLSEGSCVFSANAGEITGRFEIIYQPETFLATQNSLKDDWQVYKNGTDFILKSAHRIISKVEIYDASGRLLLAVSAGKKTVAIPSQRVGKGILILKVNFSNGEMGTKKVRN
jgi:hypothetical protein